METKQTSEFEQVVAKCREELGHFADQSKVNGVILIGVEKVDEQKCRVSLFLGGSGGALIEGIDSLLTDREASPLVMHAMLKSAMKSPRPFRPSDSEMEVEEAEKATCECE